MTQTCEGAVVKPSTLYTILKKLKTVKTKDSLNRQVQGSKGWVDG